MDGGIKDITYQTSSGTTWAITNSRTHVKQGGFGCSGGNDCWGHQGSLHFISIAASNGPIWAVDTGGYFWIHSDGWSQLDNLGNGWRSVSPSEDGNIVWAVKHNNELWSNHEGGRSLGDWKLVRTGVKRVSVGDGVQYYTAESGGLFFYRSSDNQSVVPSFPITMRPNFGLKKTEYDFQQSTVKSALAKVKSIVIKNGGGTTKTCLSLPYNYRFDYPDYVNNQSIAWSNPSLWHSSDYVPPAFLINHTSDLRMAVSNEGTAVFSFTLWNSDWTKTFWVQVWSDGQYQERQVEFSCVGLSISDDGSTIAVGYHTGESGDSKIIHIFASTNLEKIGEFTSVPETSMNLGINGNFITTFTVGTSSGPPQPRVYKFKDSKWIRLGGTVNGGQAVYDLFVAEQQGTGSMTFYGKFADGHIYSFDVSMEHLSIC